MLVAVINVGAAETPAITIHAQFFSTERATHYTAILGNEPGDELPTFVWTLELVKIDDNGTVDPTCNKTEQRAQKELVWHHADDESCDHSKEGTHGHQGRITVSVHMRNWGCKTTYDGSTGNPTDGPTMLCERLGDTVAKAPCDDARAKVAQIEAELAAARESLEKLNNAAWKSYFDNWKAKDAYWSALKGSPEREKARKDWNDAYADKTRISKAYSDLLDRIEQLRKALDEAKAALATCEGSSKRLAGRSPTARCTDVLITASRARGRLAGYTDVTRRFQRQQLIRAAGTFHAMAAHLRAAAAELPKVRGRLLGDARRAEAAANALTRSAAALAVVNTQRTAAAKASAAAQAALAKCLSGGG